MIPALDLYGQDVKLTFKGEETFATWPGFIASIILIVVVGSFAVYRAMILFFRMNPNVSQQSFLQDLDTSGSYNPFIAKSPNGTTFDISFGIGKALDPTVGTLNVNYVEWKYTETSPPKRYKVKSPVPFVPCADKYYNFPD